MLGLLYRVILSRKYLFRSMSGMIDRLRRLKLKPKANGTIGVAQLR